MERTTQKLNNVLEKKEKYLVHFDEPNCYGGNAHNTVSVQQAIEACRLANDDPAASDIDALEDFLCIHWAWIEEIK